MKLELNESRIKEENLNKIIKKLKNNIVILFKENSFLNKENNLCLQINDNLVKKDELFNEETIVYL